MFVSRLAKLDLLLHTELQGNGVQSHKATKTSLVVSML